MPRRAAFATLFAAAASAQQWRFVDGPVDAGRGAAYDTHRDRLVVFGADGETWEYDRNHLLHRAVRDGSAQPPPRRRAALVYDPLRRHVLLFGGLNTGTQSFLFGDTWTYDGARWMQQLASAAAAPSARHDAGIAFDAARGRALLYGGSGPGTSNLFDTWEHDGVQWVARTPATAPAGTWPVLAADPHRGVVVLLVQSGAFTTTWEWNGANWTQRLAGNAPSYVGAASFVYDSLRRRCVLAGAFTMDRIHEWDGTAWTSHAVSFARLRSDNSACFDPFTGRVVLRDGNETVVIGSTPSVGTRRYDAWSWDGAALTSVHGQRRPPYSLGAAPFARPGGDEVVRFGGHANGVTTNETWAWNGNAWSLATPANRPPARLFASTAPHWLGARTLLYGGSASGQLLGDLWAWTGTDWLLLAGTGPTPRAGPALAHDPNRGVLVLFGGHFGAVPAWTMLDETWEWNGTAWGQRSTAVAPTPRAFAAMTYDFQNTRVVLHGGMDASVTHADTWTWDGGTTWTQLRLAPGATPQPLRSPSLATDPMTLRPVLTGTRLFPDESLFETYDYGSAGWTLRHTSSNARFLGTTVLARGKLVLVTQDGLAELQATQATHAAYGVGCGTPAPTLVPRSRARLGDPEFGLDASVEPSAPVLFGLSFATSDVPLGNGCSLQLAQPIATVFVAANGSGFAVLPLPLPRDPQLTGITLFAQAGTLSAAAPGGFALSHGLRVMLGD